MTSSRLFPIATIIATFVAPAARSENSQPTAEIYSVDRVEQWKGTRLDDADQWKPEAPWPTVAAHTKVAKLVASNIEHTRDADLNVVIGEVKRASSRTCAGDRAVSSIRGMHACGWRPGKRGLRQSRGNRDDSPKDPQQWRRAALL